MDMTVEQVRAAIEALPSERGQARVVGKLPVPSVVLGSAIVEYPRMVERAAVLALLARLSASAPRGEAEPSDDVKRKLYLASRAHVAGDYAEAYHQLYAIADPTFSKKGDPFERWAHLAARPAVPSEGGKG